MVGAEVCGSALCENAEKAKNCPLTHEADSPLPLFLFLFSLFCSFFFISSFYPSFLSCFFSTYFCFLFFFFILFAAYAFARRILVLVEVTNRRTAGRTTWYARAATTGSMSAEVVACRHLSDHKTQQEHFSRFPSGCPLDDAVCAGHGAVPAATASSEDASSDVAMDEGDGVVIELPEDADQEIKDFGNNTESLNRRCNNFEGKWVLPRPSAEKSTWQAPRQPPRWLLICKQQRQKPQRKLEVNIMFWCGLAEKFMVPQCHDYHAVSFVESHLVRERNSSVERFLASQERRAFFAAASPSSKSVKCSHGAGSTPQLVATRGNG